MLEPFVRHRTVLRSHRNDTGVCGGSGVVALSGSCEVPRVIRALDQYIQNDDDDDDEGDIRMTVMMKMQKVQNAFPVGLQSSHCLSCEQTIEGGLNRWDKERFC